MFNKTIIKIIKKEVKENMNPQLRRKVKCNNVTIPTQWAFTCSKLTLETLEQGVEYVQS